jgi:putative flippase GtrA
VSPATCFARFGRFLIAGGSSTLLTIALLWLFTSVFGFWYLSSSIAAYALSIGCNYVLQRRWAFGNEGRDLSWQLPQFLGANLVGLLLNTTILYALVAKLGVRSLPAQAIASCGVAGLSFIAYSYIFAGFGERPSINPSSPPRL